MTVLLPTWRPCIALAVALATVSCALLPLGQSAPVRYYVLTAEATPDQWTGANTHGRLIGVQTVQLPDYLNQQSIVTRTQDNELDLAPLDQWSGSLSANATSVLVENLGTLLGSNRVIALPVSGAVPVEDVVGVEIINFERQPSGAIVLNARWIVLGGGGRSFRTIDHRRYETSSIDADYQAIAAAMSGLLAELSRDIAKALVMTPPLPPAADAGAVGARLAGSTGEAGKPL